MTPPHLRVDEKLAEAILARRPTLAQHVCKQRGFGFFGDKLVGTTLPHLVEHVAIDLLVADERQQGIGLSRPRAGATTWIDREQGTMKARLSHLDGAHTTAIAAPDDTCTAITRAVAMVNDLFVR